MSGLRESFMRSKTHIKPNEDSKVNKISSLHNFDEIVYNCLSSTAIYLITSMLASINECQ